MRKLILVALLATFAMGCYTMKAVAPAGQQLSTLAETDGATFKKNVRVWYALWGLAPISNNSSAQVIQENNLKNVRITTKHTFVDGLIGVVTGLVTIVPTTMVIEGNQ
ncbi:MAG: hypothetical protein DKINENOH_02038 [bacterium]|nr:hypothetical protein [bacterium]MCK6558315.1 Bor family protein [bacterium]NUM67857.1 hypothetical protein [candidate division KSB1 bacterium]